MAELYRYAAFISYSSKDAPFARRLHRALESYGIPASLGKFDLIGGGKRNRIYPVFRDREELSAGHLGDQIEANLRASASLIVVCSPHGAASPWVQKEIEYFAALRRERIFAIIPDTAPLRDENGGDATRSCFPPAFRGDALAGDKLEPLAADARAGKDGFRNAWLKIVAGMIGVSSGQLVDRDRRRRRVRRVQAVAAACFVAVAAGVAFVIESTRLWRGDMTAAALALVQQQTPFQALPFALAGASAPGDLISVAPEANAPLLRDLGALTLWADLGIVYGARFSADQRAIYSEPYYDNDNLDQSDVLDLAQRAQTRVGSESLPIEAPSNEYQDRPEFGAVDFGAFSVIAARGAGEARHFFVEDHAGARRDLGLGLEYWVTGNRDGIAVRRPDAHVWLYHYQNQAPPRDLGDDLDEVPATGQFGLSTSMSVLLSNARPVVIDLPRSGAAVSLREPRGLAEILSRDGRYFISENADESSTLYDLQRGGAPLDLGLLHPDRNSALVIASDGRTLAVENTDSDVLIVDISGAPARVRARLGPFQRRDFSADGRFLLVSNLRGQGLVYDLSTSPLSRNGNLAVRDLCAASGEAVLPFPARLREFGRADSRDAGIARGLRGRPWNPCDWRGLGAGAEGWSQWFRSLAIQYFGAQDYRCEERNAAGGEDVVSRRRCQRMRDLEAARINPPR